MRTVLNNIKYVLIFFILNNEIIHAALPPQSINEAILFDTEKKAALSLVYKIMEYCKNKAVLFATTTIVGEYYPENRQEPSETFPSHEALAQDLSVQTWKQLERQERLELEWQKLEQRNCQQQEIRKQREREREYQKQQERKWQKKIERKWQKLEQLEQEWEKLKQKQRTLDWQQQDEQMLEQLNQERLELLQQLEQLIIKSKKTECLKTE